jgi:hypothetical protein
MRGYEDNVELRAQITFSFRHTRVNSKITKPPGIEVARRKGPPRLYRTDTSFHCHTDYKLKFTHKIVKIVLSYYTRLSLTWTNCLCMALDLDMVLNPFYHN